MSHDRFHQLLKVALKRESTTERITDALKLLEDYQVSPELLAKTSGAKELKKLSKTSTPEVSRAVKEVLARWRLTVHNAIQGRQRNSSVAIRKTKSLSITLGSNDGIVAGKPDTPTVDNLTTTPLHSSLSLGDCSSGEFGGISPVVQQNPECKVFERTGDKTRDTVREKFAQLLEKEAESMPEKTIDHNQAACQIEKAMFERIGQSSSPGYKQKFRTLMYNLKDPKNGPLRKRILVGHILPAELVELSTEDLANEDKKRENNTIREKQLRECERASLNQATTDAFTCSRCRQNRCSYYQLQVRSADEPMTTFITCANCNHRWKQ